MARDFRLYWPKVRDGRQGYWQYKFRDDHTSTGETDYDAALRKAQQLHRDYERRRAAKRSEALVKLDAIFDLYVEQYGALKGEAAGKSLASRFGRIRAFWGGKGLPDVTPDGCRAFHKWAKATTDWAPLGDNTIRMLILHVGRSTKLHCQRIGLPAPRTWLPPLVRPSKPWLTRQEVARFIVAARGRVWDPEKGDWRRRADGRLLLLPKQSRAITRPLARFILLGAYTGSRISAMLEAGWEASRHHASIDVVEGWFYRKGSSRKATKKRQPRCRLDRGLLSLLRYWHAGDIRAGSTRHALRFARGRRGRLDVLWRKVRRRAGFGAKVTPHTLRHSCATWLMQGGSSLKGAGAFLGMGLRVIKKDYLHVHPQFTVPAARAMDAAGRDPRAFCAARLVARGLSAAEANARVGLPAGDARRPAPGPGRSAGGREAPHAGSALGPEASHSVGTPTARPGLKSQAIDMAG